MSKLSVATCKGDVSEMGHINEGKQKLHRICIYIAHIAWGGFKENQNYVGA